MAGDEKFEHESLQDGGSIARYLNALTDGFAKGYLAFRHDDSGIKLIPEGLLKLEIRAKRKEGNNRIDISVSWKDGENSGKDKPGELRIESGAL